MRHVVLDFAFGNRPHKRMGCLRKSGNETRKGLWWPAAASRALNWCNWVSSQAGKLLGLLFAPLHSLRRASLSGVAAGSFGI